MKKYELNQDKLDIKNVFPVVMEALFGEDDAVVYLDADLMNSFGTGSMPKKYPDKAFDMGIQEANMVGVAAGMSAEGKKPYIHSFGPFVSRRVYDQVFLSAAYAKNSICVIGSDPGVTAAYNGGTHMPFEDVALYRAMPEATIFDIVDATQFEKVLRLVKDMNGVKYIRVPRKGTRKVYEASECFAAGEAKVLCEGSDVTIIASGIMVAEAILAAQKLDTEGIHATVIDPVTIKPLDEACIVEYARKTGAVVTAENCNINGGLGDAVASLLATHEPTPMEKVGVQDEFGEVGTVDYLKERFNLTADAIVEKVVKVMARK